MAKKSRTTPANAATPSPASDGGRVDHQATVFNVPIVRDSDDMTAVLSVPLAPSGSDDATAMLSIIQPSAGLFGKTEPDVPELRPAAPADHDPFNGPTMRVKMVSTDARPDRAAPRFAAAPLPVATPATPAPRVHTERGGKSAAGVTGDRAADAFTPHHAEGPVSGPWGIDVAMRWGDEIHTAHFYSRPVPITIGQNGGFALPPDVMGGKEFAVLVEPQGKTDFALRLDTPGMTGALWVDGQRHDVEDIRAGRTPLKSPLVPLTVKTRAVVHFGDFTFELARAAMPPALVGGGWKRENTLLLLCFLISGVMLLGPLIAGFYSPDFRDSGKLTMAEQLKEREAELIEIENKVEPPKEEEDKADKAEEKKVETPVQAPQPKQEAQAVKQEEKKIDTLKELKGEQREEAKKELVAEKIASATAQVDDALKELNAAPASRLFQIDDSGGAAAAGTAVVTADVTGELSKDLGGGPVGTKKGIGGDSTEKRVAEGLGKDTDIGSKNVDIAAHQKAQKVIRVGSSGGDAEGELPKSVIKAYIATKMGAIKACYQKGLQSNPDLSGKVKVAFLIQPTGQVFGAKVDDSSINNSSVEECILTNVKAWHFPPAKGGGSTKVMYPFIFSSTH